jgi:hypothetical protein
MLASARNTIVHDIISLRATLLQAKTSLIAWHDDNNVDFSPSPNTWIESISEAQLGSRLISILPFVCSTLSLGPDEDTAKRAR